MLSHSVASLVDWNSTKANPRDCPKMSKDRANTKYTIINFQTRQTATKNLITYANLFANAALKASDSSFLAYNPDMPAKEDTDTYGKHTQLLGADVLVGFWEIEDIFG